MRPIGPFVLTPGTVTEIATGGDAFSSATVVLYNLSGYECLVTATGGHSGWLVAHTADRFDLADVPGWSGTLTVLPQELASNAGQAPSQMMIGRVFAAGEPVPGIYPLAIDRLSNVGNSVNTVASGTSAVQTGETPPNYLVRAAPAGYANDTLDLIDTGEAHIRGLSSNALVDFLNIIPSTTGPATVHLLGQADTVPVAGIQAGALPAGVTVPGAQVTGTIPASQVGAGYSIDNLTAGQLPSGTTVNYGGAGNGFQILENGANSNGFVLGRNAGDSTNCIATFNSSGGIGFKNSGLGGNKLAEFRGNGNMIIAGTTYNTDQSTFNFACCSSFDGFDIAEGFPVAQLYEGGTVVCPGDDDQLHLCTHDGCHAAMVISLTPGFCAGDVQSMGAQRAQPVALAGRIIARASQTIIRRGLVCSDGAGGVRAMRPGESGYALGFALSNGDGSRVPILLRPGYVSIPCPCRHDLVSHQCSHQDSSLHTLAAEAAAQARAHGVVPESEVL